MSSSTGSCPSAQASLSSLDDPRRPVPADARPDLLARDAPRLEALAPSPGTTGRPPGRARRAAPSRAGRVVGQTALPAERLERAPRLEPSSTSRATSSRTSTTQACFARGIEVLGIGPVFGQPVAELALGLALAAARDIPRGDAEIRAGTEMLFDEGVNGGSFLLAGQDGRARRLRQPRAGAAAAARAVRLRAARARPLARRRRIRRARRRAGRRSSSCSAARASSSCSRR